MICCLIDFALVVNGSWNLKNPVFFLFPVLKRLNKVKKIKNRSKVPKLVRKSFFKQFQWSAIIFWLFTGNLTLSLAGTRCAGPNTDLPSNSNISKTVTVNAVFTRNFSKEYLISFLVICRLIDFASLVLQLLMFKACGIIGISKIEFFQFFLVLKRLNKIKKI